MKSTLKIITKNIFTLFNLVNIILAAMILAVGSYKNLLFVLIAIANTLISIVNELRAKKIVDKLKILSEKPPKIEKNGHVTETAAEKVEKGDITVLTLGDQILFDSVITSGEIEVNEAFVTGEQNNIMKRQGDRLISGSFVTAGSARAAVEKVLKDSTVVTLETAAHSLKTADSKLFTLMNKIVKYISIALIPIGALLLWSRFRTEDDAVTAVTSTVAALINMLPEGLILLTSSILALATIRLSKRNVLVQDLYVIETLARVDTICLDKTGTLTTGRLKVHDLLLPNGETFKKGTTPAEKSLLRALKSILRHQTAKNATVTALEEKLLKMPEFKATSEIEKITEEIPFSSDRKYSGIKTKTGNYLMGAAEVLIKDRTLLQKIKSEHYRTLVIMKDDELLGLARLEDEVRKTAPKIVNYFYENDIDIKIISGDSENSVLKIAEKVGVKDLRAVDLTTIKTKNYSELVKNYSIFTRVTPSEKKSLIKALKKQGRTVAMTGDGVNDILAMKEADASLAIGEGSDAARRAAKFVLLDSGFEAIPSIIDEGRQSINNLERSTSLFLAKTVYASTLAVLFVVLPLSYPYAPIEMSLLNFLCIGFPGLILALEKNTARIKDQFVHNIKHYSVPTGLAVVVAMLTLSIVAEVSDFPRSLLITCSAIITFIIDLILIIIISRPLSKLRSCLIAAIVLLMLAALLLPLTQSIFGFSFAL